MVNSMFEFLSKYFNMLPAPVRIIVYCTVLVVFVYLLLLPQYIDGELVTIDETAGGEVPFSAMTVSLMADGRMMKMTTNEDGMWAIPLASKLPFQSLELGVIIDKKKYPVTVPYAKILKGRIKVVFHDDSGKARCNLVDMMRPARWGIIPAAYAAPIAASPLPGTIMILAQSDTAAVAASVAKVIRAIVKDTNRAVADSMRLREDLKLTDAKMAVLKFRIQKEWGFKAPDEDWAEAVTVGKLVRFVLTVKHGQH